MSTALSPSDRRIDKMQENLLPGIRLSIEAHQNIDVDNVILTVPSNMGACEIRIPKERYDPFALIELLDKHSTKGIQ